MTRFASVGEARVFEKWSSATRAAVLRNVRLPEATRVDTRRSSHIPVAAGPLPLICFAAVKGERGRHRMSHRFRVGVLIGVTVLAIGILAAVPPIPQDPAYHRFADRRWFLGIPNAWNVLSNGSLVLVGGLGLWYIAHRNAPGADLFSKSSDRWPYVAFFTGVLLTGFGSAYYHLAPDNARLAWDRLPMAVAFTAIVTAVLIERISRRVGLAMLPVLLIAGVGSVLYWRATELRGVGDLRPYVMVQFFPLVLVPLVMLLFPSRYTRGGDLVGAAALYGVAKVLEMADAKVFSLGHVVGGHALKHVAAAAAAALIIRMLWLRRPVGRMESATGSRSVRT